jgi:threonine aldolase
VEDAVGLVDALIDGEAELHTVGRHGHGVDSEEADDAASRGGREWRVHVTVGRAWPVGSGHGRTLLGRSGGELRPHYDPTMASSSHVGAVDLRSDTVTRPTAEMRRAMAEADVGDDGFGEDPTVNELEAMYAERVGKEAAVFVPSGTMANQIAVRVLARPGTTVIAGRRQHVVAYEAGAAARNAAVQFHLVPDPDGVVPAEDVTHAVSLAAYHQPEVSLVCIENTHMGSGGIPWTLDQLDALSAAAGDLPVHMDGARLFNAEVAVGATAAAMAARATTVMSCLSKGLCAPVGSLLAGDAALVETARVERKRLGGAMRQAGIVAAAGIVALRTMIERLADDHRRAHRLAEAVAERWPDVGADPARVRTNIVVFSPPGATAVVAHLRAHGVLADMTEPSVIRLVTHHDVDDEGIDRALVAIAKAPDAGDQ